MPRCLPSPFGPWAVDLTVRRLSSGGRSYAFLHGNLTHLLFNMFALYMFGPEIERLLGARRFLTYYIVCVVCAAIAQLIVQAYVDGPAVPTVGASGGIFGLLLAYGLAFPQRKLLLIFPPLPLPAWLFVTPYGLLSSIWILPDHQQRRALRHLGGWPGCC